jgi:hypothetical protein
MASPAFWGGVAAARLAAAGNDTVVMRPGPNSLGPLLVRGFQHAYGGRLRADGTLVFAGVRKDILEREIQTGMAQRCDDWARGYFAGAASESRAKIVLAKGAAEVLHLVREAMQRSMPGIEIRGGPAEPLYIGKKENRELVKAHWLAPPPGAEDLMKETIDSVNRRAERRDLETVNRVRIANNIRPHNARLTPTEVTIIRAVAQEALANQRPFSIHIAVTEARRRLGHVTRGQVRRALGDLLPVERAPVVPEGLRRRVFVELCSGYTVELVRQKMRRYLPAARVLSHNTLRQYQSNLRTGKIPPPVGPVPTWQDLRVNIDATDGPVVRCSVDWMRRARGNNVEEEDDGDEDDEKIPERPSDPRLLAYWSGVAQFTHVALPNGALQVNPGERLMDEMQAQFGGSRDGKFLVFRGPEATALLDLLTPYFDGGAHVEDWAQGVLAARATVTPGAIRFFDMHRPTLVARVGSILWDAFPKMPITVAKDHISVEGAGRCAKVSRWMQAPL